MAAYSRQMLESLMRSGVGTGTASLLRSSLNAVGVNNEQDDPYGSAFSLTGDLRTDIRNNMLRRQAQQLGLNPDEPDAPATFADKIPKPIMGALRGLASALEPLQLPQDVLFAAIAGTLDPKTTISERLSRIKLKDYLPFGEAPARAASGEEIFKLVGFSDEVSKWAGIAADVTVDPLVFGSWLRVTGKLAKIDELVQLGNKVDYLISPLGVAKETNKLLRRSDTYANFMDAKWNSVLEAFRNPDSRVFGIQRFGERAINVLEKILPEDTILKLQFGSEAGQQLFDASRRASVAGLKIGRDARLKLQRAYMGVEGEQGEKVLRDVVQTLEQQTLAREAALKGHSPFMQELIETEVYGLNVGKDGKGTGLGLGIGRLFGDPEELANPTLKSLLTETQTALRENLPKSVEDIVMESLQKGEAYIDGVLDASKQRIIKAAEREGRRLGLSTETIEANQRRAVLSFTNYARDTQLVDALLGYHLSGYEFISNGFRQSVFELTGNMDQADKLFRRMFAAGLRDGTKGVDELREQGTGIRLATSSQIADEKWVRDLRNRQQRIQLVEEYLDDLFQADELDRLTVQTVRDEGARAVSEAQALRDQSVAAVRANRAAANEAVRDVAADFTAAPNVRRDAAVARAEAGIEAQQARIARFTERAERVKEYHAGRAERIKQYADEDDLRFAEDIKKAVGRQVESLTGSSDGLIPALSAYVGQVRDFMFKRVERDVVNSRGGQAILNGLRRLEDEGAKYQKALADVIMAERPTTAQVNKLIQKQTAVAGLVEKHHQLWVQLERTKVGAAGTTLRSGASGATGAAERLHRITLPPGFADDSIAAMGSEGFRIAEVSRAGGRVVVEVDDRALAALRSNADLVLGHRNAGRRNSARIAKEALDAYVPPAAVSRVTSEVASTTAQLASDSLGLQRMFSPDSHPGMAAAAKYAEQVTRLIRRRGEEAGEAAVNVGAEARMAADSARRTASDIQGARADIGALRDEQRAARATAREETATARAIAAGHTNDVRAAGRDAERAVRAETAAGVRAAQDAARQQRRAVEDSIKARKAVDAAERAEKGLPRPGSTKDLRRVAAQGSYAPPGLLKRRAAIPFDGENPTAVDIVNNRIRQMLDETHDIRTVGADSLEMERILEKELTFGELWDRMTGLQALDFGAYAQGIMEGHLRRSYGLFMGGDNFQRYIDALTSGDVIIRNNVLNDSDFRQYMPNFTAEADLMAEYHRALVEAGGGAIIRRDGLVKYLEQNGVAGPRIQGALKELQSSLNNNAWHEQNLALIEARRQGYVQELGRIRNTPDIRGGKIPLRNTVVYQEREFLNDEVIGQLGELSNATFSVLESAEYAGRVLPKQNYFQNTLDVARRNGLVKSAPFMDEWGTRYRKLPGGDNALGGFGGQWVHPYLIKELERMATISRPNAFLAGANRVRALITGGYLAAPSVLAANFFGGLYQGATVGINPITMLRRMGEVLPDMLAAARGEETALMKSFRKRGDLEVTGIVSSEMRDDLATLVKESMGFGEKGWAGAFDKATRWYEDFLQRPGFGQRWRVPFAGLAGFQFTENWFKLATYKETSEYLAKNGLPSATGRGVRTLSPIEIEKLAAESARTVVFDYSTLPSSLDALKKSGILLFPGFSYFLAGRTLDAALKRPGVLAVSDRLSEALMNAQLPVEDQVLAWLGMPDWLKEEQGVPLPFSAGEGKGGNRQASFIPLAQLVPTNTMWDSLGGGNLGANPWADSITQLGLWGPLVDVFSALAEGNGEARITGKYGNRVFDPGAEGGELAGQIARFLYNTMAPAFLRKSLQADYQGRAQGLIPAMARGIMQITDSVPEDNIHGVYTIAERTTGRPDKRWQDQIVANFLRSPTTIALEGPLAGIRDIMSKDRAAFNNQRAALVARYDRARASGQEAAAEELRLRIVALMDEFNDKWRSYLELNDAYVQQRKAEKAEEP